MIKKLLLVCLILLSGIANADELNIFNTDEAKLPTRVQYGINHTWKDITVIGYNNFDLNSANGIDRIQLKNRVLYPIKKFDSLSFNFADQFEYFDYDFAVKSGITKNIHTVTNRPGLGVKYKHKYFIAETNIYSVSNINNVRYDTYLIVPFDKFTAINQYWYESEGRNRFQQFTLAYKVNKEVTFNVQTQSSTGKDSVLRLGIGYQF